ncbi:MAG: radical SAM protein [Timaviella obliquedivisa GSE-PSE-MK23-08B]|jgi:organic radical activating enzyme|nr:radical SAM protein [Timaviella obliquedivisa GSE-PSE-MK23-08B]
MKNLTLFTQQTTLPIHEQFFETIQGEGYWAGTPADFIRLAGCPVACPWCDTGYADGGKSTPRSDRTIAGLINELRSPHVVISGGEPFIHKELPMLVEAIAATGRQVQIETSGAFWQNIPNPTWVTLSPKQHLSPKYPVHSEMWQRANEIKIVISSGQEVDFYYKHLALRNACLQPEWNERDRTLPLTLDLLKQHPKFRLSLQTHKFIGVQ